jgi:hypothetical protein
VQLCFVQAAVNRKYIEPWLAVHLAGNPNQQARGAILEDRNTIILP